MRIRLLSILCLLGIVPMQAQTYVEDLRVVSPEPLSDVSGKLTVTIAADRMTDVSAFCVEELTPGGIRLTKDGRGKFRVDTKRLPAGPFTIQLRGTNAQGERDIYELQLYNVNPKATRHAGIPDTIPQGADGMECVFEDDFSNPELSISADGRGTRYNAHKPTFGDFSGWPFRSPTNDVEGPFRQRDDYLIIQARKPEGSRGSTGLLATVDMDGHGFWAQPPFYMECRMMAQSAPGTWPAFWTVTNINHGIGDELDIVEAYGGWGKGHPNSPDYWCTAHYWGQKDADGNELKAPFKLIAMAEHGRRTSWSEEFHTYGLYVDESYTIYYLDDEEVLRHPTNPVSYAHPHVLLVNYAIGGASGWKIDLERYGNRSNMYVDYIRVFQRTQP